MEQQLTFFLALAVGLVFGGLAIWIMLRADTKNTYARARAEVAAEHKALSERVNGQLARINDLTDEKEQLRAELDRLREQEAGLRSEKAELKTRLEESQKAAEEKFATLRDAREQLAESFRAVSAEALQSNNQVFLDLARQSLTNVTSGAETDLEGRQKAIDEMVKPLRESLERVQSNIQEMEQARAATHASITEQVRALVSTQDLLRNETANLVNALRTPSVRGRWGELQLRRVAELAGMSSYCDFEEQRSVQTDNGRLRPDMIIRLPNEREVVVDAKVSLKAFLEAVDTADEAARGEKLREHAAQVRAHVERLGAKGYWSQFERAPEFVVAFLPGESFFSAALEHDKGLLEYGVERNVILATPTTLIALLKAVAHGWRQERLTRNAQEISHLGRSLYARLKSFTHHMDDVGKSLARSVNGYNRAVGSLESRVLVSARRFQELGAGTNGKIASAEPVDTFPRSLAAAQEAVSADYAEPPVADAAPEPEAAQEPVSAEYAEPSAADATPEPELPVGSATPAEADTADGPVNYNWFVKTR